MSIFKGFGTGFSAYGKAFDIIFSNGLWWYFLFPVLLNILIFVGGIYGIGSLANFVEDWLVGLANLEEGAFWGAVYLKSIMSGFIWIFFKFVFFFVFATFGGYIIIILMSPVFAILSEKTEEILTGNKYPFNGDQLMRDIVRGVVIAFRNMFIELGYIIVFFIVGFIPVIGQFAAIILFVISAYFYGFAFIDYTNERRRLTINQSVRFIRQHKGMAIGNGFIFALAMFIPFCGTTIAGFVAIVSVVAATISTHKVVDLSNNPYAKSKYNNEALDGDIEA
jgi:CysZ protein